jgi:NADH:ubiquinone oxidoreductase subunit K
MRKIKNHFINLLLILEILSLRRIFMIRNLSQIINSTRLIFILMTLRVGEAVLGLAILVKLVR